MTEGDEVTADEVRTMAAEILAGRRRSESTVAMTDAHRRVWDDLVDQIGRSPEYDEPGDEPRYRLADLDPRLQRLADQIRAQPPDHERDEPDPDDPSRPELEMFDRGRSMRDAIERRRQDHALERCWVAGESTAAALGITHEWLRSITDYQERAGTRTVSDGAGNMAASMVRITPTDDGLELTFMERDWPPLVCRLRPNHARALAALVREAQVTEAPERRRYPRVDEHWAGVRAAPVRPVDGSIVLEARFESAGQRVRLPASEVTRLLMLLDAA
ncbi:MAG: hypothetical protein R8F63_00780 [Acidimicrobiales bacterium]|nr:hypothetical protein [Acidimicrobiales bacterium]